jgi:GrpB-like predicted nucleotidyltransferase (UPF0157 family)
VQEHVPLTDDEIRAATVGDLPEHNATIHLAGYDPAWPALFEREAARIRGALGDRALLVEHVGSTSAMSSASGSPTGTSTGSSRGRTRT